MWDALTFIWTWDFCVSFQVSFFCMNKRIHVDCHYHTRGNYYCPQTSQKSHLSAYMHADYISLKTNVTQTTLQYSLLMMHWFIIILYKLKEHTYIKNRGGRATGSEKHSGSWSYDLYCELHLRSRTVPWSVKRSNLFKVLSFITDL